MRVIYGLGRAVVGGFFIYNGVNHLSNTKAMAGYAGAKRLPNPELSVQASGVLMAPAGTSLLLGLKPKLGAIGALGFLAAASVLFHDYWNVDDTQAEQNDLIQFSKNVALMGALLFLCPGYASPSRVIGQPQGRHSRRNRSSGLTPGASSSARS